MARKVDWDKWRLKYVSGSDAVTLEALSKMPEAPALPSLKRHSGRESWTEQRERFRYQRDSIATNDETVVAAATEVKKIIDAAEMLTRHAKVSRSLQSLAHAWLQTLKLGNDKNKFDPAKVAKLKPGEVTALLKLALESERLTEGLATQRQEIDLSGLSDAELEKLANGGS